MGNAFKEEDREKVIDSLQLDVGVKEAYFEDCVDMVRDIFGCPISVVAVITSEYQLFKARRGLEVCSTSRDVSFCATAMFESEGLAVPNALEDDRFKFNPLVHADPPIRAYLGAPLLAKCSTPIGAVAVIDTKPRDWTFSQRRIMKRIAHQTSLFIEQRAMILTSGLGNPLVNGMNDQTSQTPQDQTIEAA